MRPEKGDKLAAPRVCNVVCMERRHVNILWVLAAYLEFAGFIRENFP